MVELLEVLALLLLARRRRRRCEIVHARGLPN
jgi:hypothetical protein